MEPIQEINPKTGQAAAVVFDWGGTIMKLLPEYTGAMVDWPHVELVDGIYPVLQELSDLYPLYIATNAVDSSSAQVRGALARAGVDQFFRSVFTFHQLGSRKPESSFYHSLSSAIGAPPSLLWMVGDEFRADVWGAWAAGWHSAWYNPGYHAAPGLQPVQSADLYQMSDLPACLARPGLPTVQTCLDWLLMEGAGMRVLLHVQGTAAVAYQLALWLKEKGEAVNPILAHRGGLVHDLSKMASLGAHNPDLHHGEMAARRLTRLGQPELAEIARRHMLFEITSAATRPITWEQKLVYFADKLMEGAQLVPLERRLDALQQRYQLDPAQLQLIQPALVALRDEISAGLHAPYDHWFDQLVKAFSGQP